MREKIAVVSGIGCSGRVAGYIKLDSFHTTHGRAIPFATGLKLANPDLHVVVFSGDGDLIAIASFAFGAVQIIDPEVDEPQIKRGFRVPYDLKFQSDGGLLVTESHPTDTPRSQTPVRRSSLTGRCAVPSPAAGLLRCGLLRTRRAPRSPWEAGRRGRPRRDSGSSAP